MNADSNPETQIHLIAKIRDSGDEEAWNEFVQIYQPVVQRFVQRRGLQYADAAEVTQEVLSRVARSIDSWDSEHAKSTFRGWLYRITRNLTIDFLRKRRTDWERTGQGDAGLSQVAGSTDEQSQEFQAEFEKQIFYWAAESLKPSIKAANWQAFWLSTVEGIPVDQVARQLGLKPGNIYVARSRIMARLSKMIQQRLNETQD